MDMMIAALALAATLTSNPQTLVQQAVKGDAAAVRQLRAMGQPAVDLLIKHKAPDAVLEAVCKQRDCRWSGLYWHTDLEEAKRAAHKTGRPILSLHLLGNLDEELSCANSRYFRTLLYSNLQIRAYLRANYVLHWKSVRPAPKLTIDFGDGRQMRRTITGNSIHYVLDPDGNPINAIPGLYSAPSFLSLLRESALLHRKVWPMSPGERRQALANYHSNARFVARQPRRGMSPLDAANDYGATRADRMTAWTSGSLAPSKSGGEAVVIEKVSFDARARGFADEMVKLVSQMVAGPSTIDENSKALIRAKRKSDAIPGNSFEPMLKQLEKSIAADEKINEQKLRPELHRAIADIAYSGPDSLETLNTFVYEHLFLAPNRDPWMGLQSNEAFTAIQGEGLVVSR